jgi:tyrosyl-tRNA synthetase
MNSINEKQIKELLRGIEEVLPHDGLREKLKLNRPLRVKAGFDPTAPDLHLGHTVIIEKLRQFQALGHEVIFLVGDFTALIGDPTGKNITRKPLSESEIKTNSKTYIDQVFKILDPALTRIEFNNTWMAQVTSADMIKLTAKYTLARMIERDDFSKRFAQGSSIHMHELLYPLVQGYDSVMLEADIELGGTDQKFNLLVGRHLQQSYGQDPQIALTLPLLEGLDGVNKMSKSLNNYIAIKDSPKDMFGKIMSLSDALMWRYFRLLSSRSSADIESLKQSALDGENPRDIKFLLGQEMVERFYSKEEALQQKNNFIEQFQKGNIPEDLLTIEISVNETNKLNYICYLLREISFCTSTSEAIRMIKQGAVSIDENRILDQNLCLTIGKSYLIRVGKKKICKVKLINS